MMPIQLLSPIIPLSAADKALHKQDPRTRIFTTLILITGIILADHGNWLQFGALACWLILNILFSQQSYGIFFKRLLKIYPMIFLMSFMFLFTKPAPESIADPLLTIGKISVFSEGLISFFDLNVRSLLIVSSGFFLIFSVPFAQIIQACAKLKLPDWIEAILIYMHRFIFLMADEFSRIHMAYKSRTINQSVVSNLKMISNFTEVYFTRLIERSESTHLSMLSKGFTGKIYSLNSISWRPSDSVSLVFNTLVILTIIGFL